MKKCVQILFLLILVVPHSSFGQFKSDCNIPINPNRIYYGYNLDGFIKRLQNDSFYVSNDRKEIPHFIAQKLHCLVGDMASLNEDWSSGCIQYDDLPIRQIQFHAINRANNTFVIVYKKGGIGVSTTIIMMKLTSQGVIVDEQKNVTDFWVGRTLAFEDYMGFSDLATFLNENRHFERLNSKDLIEDGFLF